MKTVLQTTTIATLTVAIAALPASAFAGGGGMFAGATLPEQIIQEATSVEQLARQAQEVQQQIQMVINQVKNLESIPEQLWASAKGDIQQLVQVAAQAQGVNYATQNTYGQFNQIYGQNGIPPLSASYTQSLQNWTTDTQSQIQSMLQQYHLNASQFQTEQGALQGIENASQSATGRMQVLQAANQIAGMEVNQIQQLQQDVMAGNSAMGSYIAQKTAAEEKKQEDERAFADKNATAGFSVNPDQIVTVPVNGEN